MSLISVTTIPLWSLTTDVELGFCSLRLLKLSQIQTTVSFRIHMGTTYNLHCSCNHLYSAQIYSSLDLTIVANRFSDTACNIVFQAQRCMVGHAYGTPCHVWLVKFARSTWRQLSKCVFVLCPVARTRSCRSTILGSRIVEMGPYCSYVSVALGCHNFAARAS